MAETMQEAVDDLRDALRDLSYVLFWDFADWPAWRWILLGVTPSFVVLIAQVFGLDVAVPATGEG